MMRQSLSALAVVLFIGTTATAAIAQDVVSRIDPTWIAPSHAAARQNPMRNHPDAAAGGRKIFQHTCLNCHGDETHKRTNDAPDLTSSAVQSEPDGALFWRISEGNARRKMPSFSNLPEAQRWQLVLYIRSIARPNDTASQTHGTTAH